MGGGGGGGGGGEKAAVVTVAAAAAAAAAAAEGCRREGVAAAVGGVDGFMEPKRVAVREEVAPEVGGGVQVACGRERAKEEEEQSRCAETSRESLTTQRGVDGLGEGDVGRVGGGPKQHPHLAPQL